MKQKQSKIPIFTIKNSRLLKILFLGFGLLMVCLFIANSELENISKQMLRINWRFAFIIAVTGFSYFLASIAWKLCLHESEHKISVFKLFFVRLIGESFAQINPANVLAGDTLKLYYLKKHGLSTAESLSSITMSRFLIIISGLHLIVIFFVIFFEYFDFFPSFITITAISVISILLMLISFYFFKNQKGILYPVCRLISGFKWTWMTNAHTRLCEANECLNAFYNEKKTKYWAAYFLSLFHRIAGAAEFYLILYFIKIRISFIECIGIEIGVMVFKSLGSFVPGQIGVEEYANKLMLQLANISEPYAWVVVSIIKRARQIFWILLGMIPFILITRLHNLKIKDEKENESEGYANAATIYNS
ncbi:MAG: lysylphosphatidylglycerol synthase transmembrane domain-containing protein [Spirochaetota bacterium]